MLLKPFQLAPHAERIAGRLMARFIRNAPSMEDVDRAVARHFRDTGGLTGPETDEVTAMVWSHLRSCARYTWK